MLGEEARGLYCTTAKYAYLLQDDEYRWRCLLSHWTGTALRSKDPYVQIKVTTALYILTQ